MWSKDPKLVRIPKGGVETICISSGEKGESEKRRVDGRKGDRKGQGGKVSNAVLLCVVSTTRTSARIAMVSMSYVSDLVVHSDMNAGCCSPGPKKRPKPLDVEQLAIPEAVFPVPDQTLTGFPAHAGALVLLPCFA